MKPQGRSRSALEAPGAARSDRRILRTRRLLHEALGTLVREKVYDRITVAEILERANIGRSTFYTHFRDKDDLLSSSISNLLDSDRPSEQSRSLDRVERMLRFSLPLFEHIHSHRSLSNRTMGERGRAMLHEHLRQVLSARIIQDIAEEPQRRKSTTRQVSPELLAQYIASTFVLVLHWWLDCRGSVAPSEADKMFRALVVPTLVSAKS